MHEKVKMSENELENINGGHERAPMHNDGTGAWTHVICSKCGHKSNIDNWNVTDRWDGCDHIYTATCPQCGTVDELH